jgi:signal transduction histidine kinase
MEVQEEGERIWTALQRVRFEVITSRRSPDELKQTLIDESFRTGGRPISGQFMWADLCGYIHDRYLHCFINNMLLPLPHRDVSTNQQVFDQHTMLLERMRVLFSLFRGQPWGEHGLSMLHDVSNIMLSLASRVLYEWSDAEDASSQTATLAHHAFDLSTVTSIFHIVFMLNKTDAMNKSVSLKVHGDMVEIAEPARCDLFRAVNELVVNAVKYCDPEKEACRVLLKSTPVKKRLDIQVEDNGLGMQDPERAMLKGVRLHPCVAHGDGTGLYNVSELAASNEWRFDVVSVPGVGSSFTLGLPINMIGLRMVAGG